jgi:hypothetical protein
MNGYVRIRKNFVYHLLDPLRHGMGGLERQFAIEGDVQIHKVVRSRTPHADCVAIEHILDGLDSGFDLLDFPRGRGVQERLDAPETELGAHDHHNGGHGQGGQGVRFDKETQA